ncbi:hypothetical protein GGR58DRAFT_292765 [Xylaria digitata]|nr:hypothetical protein GGR58DRAFT_292765 [Xylaria digitata]
MELLRQIALSMYDEYDNFDASSAAELKIVRINAEDRESDIATCEIEDACEANVLGRISSALASRPEHATASLLLVNLWTSRNGDASEGIGISKTSFLGLVDALEIDGSVLQPLVNNVFGLLDFSEPISGNSSAAKGTSTYFLTDARMRLIWSFNFITSETKGILIIRRESPGLQIRNQRRGEFLASLSRQRKNIFSPYTLLFVTLVQSAQDARPGSAKLDCRGAFEWKTEYGNGGRAALPQTKGAVSSGTTLESLAVAVRRIETPAASLATDERQSDVIDSMLDVLSDESVWQQRLAYGSLAKRRIELCERDTGVFRAVVHPLRQQNSASRSALRCAASQVRSQLDLIAVIRAQEEARVNREMAAASREIAEAAKRDTASMKTIAVMTMAFLLGTFFAALFSMPSLRWDQTYIVTDRFWVYWVFTLPVTAFVFLIWMVLSYDDGFRIALDEYQQGKSMKLMKNGLLDAC